MIIAVENIGQDRVSNCSASLVPVAPFQVTGPDASLGDLDPGEIAVASFQVDVDGDAGPEEYQLGLGLRSEKMDLVVPFELSLKRSNSLLSNQAILFIALVAL